MRTASNHRRKGVAAKLLEHILEEAKRRNYKRVSLETGSMDAFIPAQNLYAKLAFKKCGPFADYIEDPYSGFMTIELSRSRVAPFTPDFDTYCHLSGTVFCTDA